MSGVVWGDELPQRDLAVDIFRAPGRHADLLNGRGILPPETGDILDRAAEAVRLGSHEALTEAHRAALFFAEHVLLARDADYYRVLGLGGQATSGEIRERYHLLMRVFHPDRCAWLGVDAGRLAAQINLAWQTLRNPASRSAYDLSLRQVQLSPTSSMPDEPARRRDSVRRDVRRRSPAERLVGGLPPVLRRNLAQFVLGGVGMIGALMVATAYFSRVPDGAIGGRRSTVVAVRTVPEQKTPEVAVTAATTNGIAAKEGVTGGSASAPVAPVRGTQPDVPVRGGSVTTVADVRAAAAVITTVPVAPRRIDAPDDGVVRTVGVVAADGNAGVTRQDAPAVRVAEVDVPVAGTGQAAGVPSGIAGESRVAVVSTAAAAVQVAPQTLSVLRPEEARNTVRRFAELYQLGDIERFMQLFSADAHSASGNRAEIRRDYEDLFRTTQVRQVDIADFRWSLDQLSGHGEGAYYIRIRRAGEADEEAFAGSLRVDLVKHGGQVLISGLFHKPAR